MGSNETEVSAKQDSHEHQRKSRSELLSQARGAVGRECSKGLDLWLQKELRIRKPCNSFIVFL